MSLPELPRPDLLVECAQSFVDGWTKGKVLAYAADVLRYAIDKAAPSDAMEPRNYLPMAIENDRIRKELLGILGEFDRPAT